MIVLDFRHLTSRPPAVTEFYELTHGFRQFQNGLYAMIFTFCFSKYLKSSG